MNAHERNDSPHRLSQELTVHSITSALNEIQDLVRSKNDVQIDLSDVDQMDTCGLQLLLVACQIVRQEGRNFQLMGEISQDIHAFIKESGFQEQFDDMLDSVRSKAVV